MFLFLMEYENFLFVEAEVSWTEQNQTCWRWNTRKAEGKSRFKVHTRS